MSFMEITKQIAGFFKFANPSHPSRVVNSWLNADRGQVIASIYQRCVCCNTERSTKEQLGDLSQVKLGTNLYFCSPSEDRTWKIDEAFRQTEMYTVFENVWNQHLFRSKI